MSLIIFSASSNYVIATRGGISVSYDMGIVLNGRVVDNNIKTSIDFDIICCQSKLPVYQTNLTVISDNTIISDLNNNITNSKYGLTFNINNILATTPNDMYSTLLTDSTIQINDLSTTIYDSQYTPSSIWVKNTQTQSITSLGSFVTM